MERLMKVLCVLVVMVCVAPAMAATYDPAFGGAWIGPASGGSWGDAANWVTHLLLEDLAEGLASKP